METRNGSLTSAPAAVTAHVAVPPRELIAPGLSQAQTSALEVLKTQKLLGPRQIGSDDVERLAEEEEKAANERQRSLNFSRSFVRPAACQDG